MKRKTYVRCTKDKYELPVAVADSPKELAILTGTSYGTVKTSICRRLKGWYSVEVDDE